MALQASFSAGQFHITWNLDVLTDNGSSPVNQQAWDRIEIKTVEDDMFVATAVTQSALPQDSIIIPQQAPVQFGSPHYAAYISSDLDTAVAKSPAFVPSQEEAGAMLTEEKDVCNIVICEGPTKIEENGSPNIKVVVEWEFSMDVPSIGTSDMFCIVPVDRVHEFKDCMYEYAYGFASGKESGYVDLYLGGFVKTETAYQILYLENTNQFRLGASLPFAISDPLDADEMKIETVIKPATQAFNMGSMMRYQLQEQKKKTTATSLNPLLTIVPEESKWEALLAEEEERYKQAEKEMEEEKERAVASKEKESAGSEQPASTEVEQDELLDENAMEDAFKAATASKPAFLFAGAGISMSAPSSSPSWWALMSQLLDLTFQAMPSEHERDVKKLHTSDNSRNPEEVMETYFFILQEKLFSLFELLEAGEPNANHRAIAKMAKNGKLKTILTTNFDIFIERALDAEGVPYRVICTDEEYKDYYQNGLDQFAVMKIHGTIAQPETIVAVANHYKTGKGFGGWKATVLLHFVKNFPTIFFGYSGWDFIHQNYQQFWEMAGKEGGESIFFLKYKGARGGPLISKLVGKHVGEQRLVLGEAILPDWACSVMEDYDGDGASEVMEFHRNVDVDAAKQLVEEKRLSFMTDWVSRIPKPALLTLLMEEAGRLSDYIKKRQERMKATKDEGDTTATVGDTTSMSTYIMALAADMASGKISMEEYMEKQQMATLEMTFASVVLPKDKKTELMKGCIELNKSHPVLSGPESATYGSILPSMLSNISEVDATKSAEDMLAEAVKYVETVVEPLREKKESGDRKSEVLHQLYLYHSMILRLSGEERAEIETLYDTFASEAADKGWDDVVVGDRIAKDISPALQRAAFDQIDIKSILKSQVDYALSASFEESATVDETLESAMMIALGRYRQAQHLLSEMHSMEAMKKVTQMLGQNESKDIPDNVFKALEEAMNEDVNPVLEMLQGMAEQGAKGEHLTPEEVLATFKLANCEILRVVFQYLGDGYQSELNRSFKGYYPREALPKSVARYLGRELLKVAPHIKDDRAEQPCLGMLVILGECTGDIEQMQNAVNTSLEITEGKVTELTPYPIPESLAQAYQEAGDMDKALDYYKLALEGIRTFVMRQKTDAIVLNACLVQSVTDKAEALRMAFEFSPQYSACQQFGLVGPGRGLLVQQCTKWAAELGFESVSSAQAALTKSDH